MCGILPPFPHTSSFRSGKLSAWTLLLLQAFRQMKDTRLAILRRQVHICVNVNLLLSE
jgi:hypothetical protein